MFVALVGMFGCFPDVLGVPQREARVCTPGGNAYPGGPPVFAGVDGVLINFNQSKVITRATTPHGILKGAQGFVSLREEIKCLGMLECFWFSPTLSRFFIHEAVFTRLLFSIDSITRTPRASFGEAKKRIRLKHTTALAFILICSVITYIKKKNPRPPTQELQENT